MGSVTWRGGVLGGAVTWGNTWGRSHGGGGVLGGAVTWGLSHGGPGYLGGQSHGVTHGGPCTCAAPLSSGEIAELPVLFRSSLHRDIASAPPPSLPPPPSSCGTYLILQSFFCSSLRCDMRRLNARKARWIVMAARTSLSNLYNEKQGGSNAQAVGELLVQGCLYT